VPGLDQQARDGRGIDPTAHGNDNAHQAAF
jgi:hypothetical protein